ncbi:type VI secretion system protein ImpI [Methylobacterium brachiatum]|uniref:Type VI secretion system protein ImpI n=1 Tax=Methylobacterium brachiatum TaxID=269660 RepID=A0AAJ1U240_9HYPH|nr:type VI secretion system-associated FHA domain protein TagH [Methylobacterium brachiatum]MCB4805507.1 type VI secretion system-associated FHA domain protein TagH [Methylobacterium brachiatum]MDQ0546558.1 type VI secretion system protein ImpI [Methylobacterium brachiatum]
MTLTLQIENFTVLPDGGPLSISLSGKRGIDIGRDQYLDWTLPDPDRVISGKHAEIRHRDGGFWLRDVSRNGVFVNRNAQRLQEAYQLKDGDRIQIGQYVILARIDGAAAHAQASPSVRPAAAQDYWDVAAETPSVPSHHLRSPDALRPVRPDFVDWLVDLPEPAGLAGTRPSEGPGAVPDWEVPKPTPLPVPRRPPEPPFPTPAFDPPVVAPQSPTSPVRVAPASPPEIPSASDPWAVSDGARFAGAPGPSSPPAAEPSRSGSADLDADTFVRRFAAGLGIPPEILAWQDAGDLAEEAGAILRLNAENVKQLLAARTESKRAARAANQTTIQALDNNPLKFSPTVDDALRIMMGRPSSGYLEARRAMEVSFRDLKTHQIKTYAAMQNALRLLAEELSPEGIVASDEKDRGLGGLLGSRKARLWDIYTTRWDALASLHDEGMVDAFMVFFADCYDKVR